MYIFLLQKYVLRDNIARKIDVFDSLLKEHSRKHKDMKVELCLMLQYIQESMGTLLEVFKQKIPGKEEGGNEDGDNADKEDVIYVESQEVGHQAIIVYQEHYKDVVNLSAEAEDDVISRDIAATNEEHQNIDRDIEGVEIVSPSKFPVAKKGQVKPYVSNKEKRRRKPGPYLKTPYTAPTKKRKIDSSSTITEDVEIPKHTLSMGFVLKRPYQKEWLTECHKWMKDPNTNNDKIEWIPCIADKLWFVEAIAPDKWLRDVVSSFKFI